jgi:hypothetical protein
MGNRSKASIGIITTLTVFFMAVAIALLMRRQAGQVADSTGHWKSSHSVVDTSADGDRYRAVIENLKGLFSGAYTGTVRTDVMYVSAPLAPLCGQIDFNKESSQLEFCGEDFERTQTRTK